MFTENTHFLMYAQGKRLQVTRYTVDLCLLSHKDADMQAKLDDSQLETVKVSLKIN